MLSLFYQGHHSCQTRGHPDAQAHHPAPLDHCSAWEPPREGPEGTPRIHSPSWGCVQADVHRKSVQGKWAAIRPLTPHISVEVSCGLKCATPRVQGHRLRSKQHDVKGSRETLWLHGFAKHHGVGDCACLPSCGVPRACHEPSSPVLQER